MTGFESFVVVFIVGGWFVLMLGLAYKWGVEDGYMKRYEEEIEREIQENDDFRWFR